MTADQIIHALLDLTTPGKWSVGPYNVSDTSWVAVTNTEQDEEHPRASVWTWPAADPVSERQAEADALLIAIAPDLLRFAAASYARIDDRLLLNRIEEIIAPVRRFVDPIPPSEIHR